MIAVAVSQQNVFHFRGVQPDFHHSRQNRLGPALLSGIDQDDSIARGDGPNGRLLDGRTGNRVKVIENLHGLKFRPGFVVIDRCAKEIHGSHQHRIAIRNFFRSVDMRKRLGIIGQLRRRLRRLSARARPLVRRLKARYKASSTAPHKQ